MVVSPLSRALQTCLGTLGTAPSQADASALAYSDWQASKNDIPIVVSTLVREHLSSSCDVGSSPADLARKFPYLDFSRVEAEGETWWRPRDLDGKLIAPIGNEVADGENVVIHEPTASLEARCQAFKAWCLEQPEDCIAVFAHCHFIRYCIGGVPPANCEVAEWELAVDKAPASSLHGELQNPLV